MRKNELLTASVIDSFASGLKKRQIELKTCPMLAISLLKDAAKSINSKNFLLINHKYFNEITKYS